MYTHHTKYMYVCTHVYMCIYIYIYICIYNARAGSAEAQLRKRLPAYMVPVHVISTDILPR